MHIFPQGSDRSWTREFYYTINQVIRRTAWERGWNEKVNKAIVDAIVYGKGYIQP